MITHNEPESVRQKVRDGCGKIALVGCVAGAVLVSETRRMAKEAGLADIGTQGKSGYIDGMADWRDPLHQKIVGQLPAGAKPGDYITSLKVTAKKPASAQEVCEAAGKSKCCG